MPVTGWTGEPPDAEGPAPLPVTSMLLARQEHRAGVLETSLARAAAAEAREIREEAAAAPDPDNRAAGMIARGLLPGMVSQLSQRLADVTAELEAEREKLEKGERRAERAQREHAAGRLDAWGMQRMLDGDLGDAHRAGQLERRAEGLRRQLEDAQAMIAPPSQRDPDPLESVNRAAQAAHDVFREVTRARIAELGTTRRPSRPAPRPFGSVSRGAAGTEHTGPDCWVCAEGRRMDAARARDDDRAPYPPDAVITTGYRELAR
jgi:hypothetical protein